MSGTIVDPLTGLTAEDSGDLLKRLGVVVPSAAASFATNLAPDPEAGPAGAIPGTAGVERLGGLAGAVYDFTRRAVPPLMDVLGVTPHLQTLGLDVHTPTPDVPLLNRAGERAAAIEDKIYNALPHTDDPNNQYQAEKIIGSAVGGVLPVPGLGQLTSLAPITKPLAMILPTTHGVKVNIPLAGALGAGAAALAPDQAEAKQGDTLLDTLSAPTQAQPTQTEQPTAPRTLLDALGQEQLFEGQGESPVSIGQIAAGVAAAVSVGLAAKYLHGLSGATTAALRDARMAAPAFTDAARDFANQRMDVLTGGLGAAPGTKIEAPVPWISKVQEMATKAKAGLIDENELLKNYISLTSDSPTVAQKLGAQVGYVYDEMAWQNRLRQFLTTGTDFKTGQQMPALGKYHEDLGALSNDQLDTYRRGLYAANELDNRLFNRNKGLPIAEHDFPYASDQDLARAVVTMQRDPVLKELAQRSKQINDIMIDIGEQRNFFSASEAADIKKWHPNYVPEVDKNGRVLHAMGPRQMTPIGGIEEISTDPWMAQAQHVELLLRQYELNELRTALVDHFLNVQDNVPGAPRVLDKLQNYGHNTGPTLYPTVAAQSADSRDLIVSVRRPTGTEYYRVDDPFYAQMLNSPNNTRFHTTLGTMEMMRHLLQTGTTGLLATASGRVFPLTNAFRTVLQGPINAPKGYSTGLLDTALQAATGNRVNYRLPDPSTLVGVPYAMARGAVDDLALQLSKLFDSGNANFATQMLNSTLTPATVNRIGQSLKNYYLSTATNEMRAAGLGGQGTPFRARPPSVSAGDNTVRLVSGQLNPTLFMPQGKWGTIKGHYLRLQNAADEIFSELSDATHQYYYRLNRARGMSPEMNTSITRDLVGNPSNVGSSMAARALRASVPYANISLQGMTRLGSSLKNAPLGTTAGIVGSLGSLAMLSLYTAMQSPEAMDYLSNVVSLQSRAANVHLFTDPDPSIHAEYSLPQELRAPYAMMLDVLHKAFMTDAARTDNDAHDGVYGFLKDWFGHQVSNETWQSSLHGAADALNILDVPPLAKAAIYAGGGGNLQLDANRIVQDAMTGQLGLKSFAIPQGADRPLPNQPPGDAPFDGEDAKKWRNIASAVFGMFGSEWDRLVGMYNYTRQGHSLWDSIGQVGKDWLQAAMDANPNLNSILWENPARASRRPPIIENVQRQLDIMKQTQGFRSAERLEGYTGGGHNALPVTTLPDEHKVPTDPIMSSMYQRIGFAYDWIYKVYMPQIQAMRSQMANEAQQFVNNRERREWENGQVRKIADIYQTIQKHIEDLNAQLSQTAGTQVRFDRIDWKKGPEQFH